MSNVSVKNVLSQSYGREKILGKEREGSSLLSEYLKAINRKDQQLHELLRATDEHRNEIEEKEAVLQESLRVAENKLRRKKDSLCQLKKKVTEDAIKIEQLSLLVDKLRNRLNSENIEMEKMRTNCTSVSNRLKEVKNALDEKEQTIEALQKKLRNAVADPKSSSETVEKMVTKPSSGHPFNVLSSTSTNTASDNIMNVQEKVRLQQVIVNGLQREVQVLKTVGRVQSISGNDCFCDAAHEDVKGECETKGGCNTCKLEMDELKEAVHGIHLEMKIKCKEWVEEVEGLRLKNQQISEKCTNLEAENAKLKIENEGTRLSARTSENSYLRKLSEVENVCLELRRKIESLTEVHHNDEIQAHVHESENTKRLHDMEASHVAAIEEVKSHTQLEKEELQHHLTLCKEELLMKSTHLEAAIRSANESDRQKEQERVQKQEELIMLRAERDQLRVTVSDCQAKLVEKSSVVEKLLTEVSEARSQLKEKQNTIQTTESCWKKERQCEAEMHQHQLEILKSSLKAKIEDLREVERKLRIENLEKERAVLESEFSIRKIEVHSDAVCQQLKCQLEKSAARENQLKDELERVMREKSSCDTYNQVLLNRVNQLEVELTALQTECTAINCRAEQVERVAARTVEDLLCVRTEAAQKLKKTVPTEQDTEVKMMNDMLKSSANSGDCFTAHLSENTHVNPSTVVEDHLTKIRVELETAELRRSEAETTCANLNALRQSEQQQHENAIEQCHRRIEELEEALSSRTMKYKSVKRSLRESQEQLADCEERLQEVEKQVITETSVTLELRERYRKEKEKMNRELEQYETQIAQLKQEERASRGREASILSDLEKCESDLREKEILLQNKTNNLYGHLPLPPHISPALATLEGPVVALSKNLSEETVLKSLYDELQNELDMAHRRLHSMKCSHQKLMDQAQRDYIDTASTVKSFISVFIENVWAGWREHQMMFRSCHSLVQNAAREKDFAEEKVSLMLKQHENENSLYEKKCESMILNLEEEWKNKLALSVQRTRADIRKGRQDLLDRIESDAAEKEKLESLLDEKSAAYQGVVATNERLMNEIKYHRQQVETLRSRLAEEEDRFTEVKRDREAINRDLASEAQTLRAQLEEAVLECRHAEEEIRSLKSELAATKQSSVEKEVELQRGRQQLKSSSGKIASITTELEAAKNDIVALSTQLSTVSAQLANEKDASQRYIIQLSESELRWESQLCELEAKVSVHLSEKKKLERMAEQNQREVDGLRSEVSELHRAVDEGQEAFDAKGSELSLLRERCANVESLKNILEGSLQASQERECRLRSQLDDMRRSHQIMQVCFDKQQNQINSSSMESHSVVENNNSAISTLQTCDKDLK